MMKTYCMKCRRDRENIDPKIVRTKKKKIHYAVKMSWLWNKKDKICERARSKGFTE